MYNKFGVHTETDAYEALRSFAIGYGGIYAVKKLLQYLNEGKTYKFIGNQFGLSEGRICQIKSAITKKVYVLNDGAQECFERLVIDAEDRRKNSTEYIVNLREYVAK